MDKVVEFIGCPAYLDDSGASRCGLPAEVVERYSLGSTEGLLDAAAIVCPLGHRFSGLLDSLTVVMCGPPAAGTHLNVPVADATTA